MKDEEAKKVLIEGFDFVCNQARLISMMPIEDWLDALEKSEAIAPFVDPTFYREYIYSKNEVLKKILRAALELKRVVQEVQPDVITSMREGR